MLSYSLRRNIEETLGVSNLANGSWVVESSRHVDTRSLSILRFLHETPRSTKISRRRIENKHCICF